MWPNSCLILLCLSGSALGYYHQNPAESGASGTPGGPGPLEKKPRFLREPLNVTTYLGQKIVLPCSVENLPPGAMPQWTKQEFGLGIDRQLEGFERYTMTGSNWKSKSYLIYKI